MRPRCLAGRSVPAWRDPAAAHNKNASPIFTKASRAIYSKARPTLPFLIIPKTSPAVARSFTSERKRWLKHEAKLFVRYTTSLGGIGLCMLALAFLLREESNERDFPTPFEWRFLTKKFARDAHVSSDPKNGKTNWARALELTRGVTVRLEDAKVDGSGVVKLPGGIKDPELSYPEEFISCDITAMSEEWRRGYFQISMLAAKAAEHVDGWVRDVTRNVVCAPEFVLGPSNPRPKPIPTGNPHAPREEDCEIAYPTADRWYVKILGTKGFTPRQRLEAALEFASFLQFKDRLEECEELQQLALKEALSGQETSEPPYDPKTYVLRDGNGSPSLNVLDALTAIATYKARHNELSSALAMFISLLKARRSLPDSPPPADSSDQGSSSIFKKIASFIAPPPYSPPPPDGTQPPWRSPAERCHEASLHLYIGEILFATSSQNDGVSWTRDGVDIAEEQLRSSVPRQEKEARQTCQDCLTTGLENWSTMVSKLVKAEEANRKGKESSAFFSFWRSSEDKDSQWAAEEAVVQERARRMKELIENVEPPPHTFLSYFKA